MIRPIAIDEEISLDPFKTIMSKTDSKGIIEYANDYFIEISGYKEWELMGKPHNILRHPDMPKVVFKVLWDKLKQGEPTIAVVKNLAKDGRYYWVVADFISKLDSDGNVISHYARRKAVPDQVKEEIGSVYNTLLNIEKNNGMEASEVYLQGFLEDRGLTYEGLIYEAFDLDKDQLYVYMTSEINDESLTGQNNDLVSAEKAIKKTTKKKGLFKKLFG